MTMKKDVLDKIEVLGGIAKPKRLTGRSDKNAIISWHGPEVRKILRQIAYEQETTQQKIMQEALNLVFAKYGKPQVA
jgi:hypothetical protein